jgi:hypothetical protein
MNAQGTHQAVTARLQEDAYIPDAVKDAIVAAAAALKAPDRPLILATHGHINRETKVGNLSIALSNHADTSVTLSDDAKG